MANGIVYSSVKSPQHPKLSAFVHGIEPSNESNAHFSSLKLKISNKYFRNMHGKLRNFVISSRGSSLACRSTETQNTKTKECARHISDQSDVCSAQVEDEHIVGPGRTISSCPGLAEACKFVCNDAKYVNERARNDIVLLSRGIMRLDARARQDVAVLGMEFLKLDASSQC